MSPTSPLPDGLYDLLLDERYRGIALQLRDAGHAEVEHLTGAARRRRLAEVLARLLPELLEETADGEDDREREQHELALVNDLLIHLRRGNATAGDWTAPVLALRAIYRGSSRPAHPSTGVVVPWLFTAGRADPSLFAELRAELGSANQVDVVVSFITWSGLRKLLDVLETVTAVGADGQPRTRLRVITTTYTGATEARAVETLAALPGVELRISLDGRRSRLHAKAWLFHRATGFGTAFVGSANLSAAALLGGVEWTVKFTQAGQSDLFAAAEAHFETLWNDPEFQRFDPQDGTHRQELRRALKQAKGTSSEPLATPTWFDLQPKTYQQAMLDRLAAERRHGRTRNLVVAATGTGKTVVAAFDYKRLCEQQGGRPRLLFVAHRVELLRQALETYRQVLRAPSFGEVLAEGREPDSCEHLFATIMSVVARSLVANHGADYWNTVVIDECHHLPANQFDSFASTIRPRFLLGLTATPERADGRLVLPYFDARPDGSPAVELRLWDALDQQLLAPFEYYATNDSTDLSGIRWNQPGELAQLANVISGNDARARLVVHAVAQYVADHAGMRAIAFCVDIAHANFMAECLTAAGLPALAITSATPREVRERAPRELAAGTLKALCTVDLFNEGVDIPEANTLLFLRPTQSPVVFQQQLGRGLRLAQGKESCLVLDFVGRLQNDFRFDVLYRAITGLNRQQLIEAVEQGFTTLPPGCHIQFDRVARDRVLSGLRQISNQTWHRLIAELRYYASTRRGEPLTLTGFVRDQCFDLDDLYDGKPGWTALRRAAGFVSSDLDPDEIYLGKHLGALLHVDDPTHLHVLRRVAESPSVLIDQLAQLAPSEQRRIQMLAYQLFSNRSDLMDVPDFLARMAANPAMCRELGELGACLDERADLDPEPLPGVPADWPLSLHAAYHVREILTAVGWLSPDRRPPFVAGVLALHDPKVELLFVTLDKRDGFAERIAYHDYAISPELFHWQSQNSAGPDTPAGRRYCESPGNGWQFQLFVRETRDQAYCALGPVVLECWEGNRPLSVTWRLQRALPIALFRRYSVLRT
jgi:superfamily II DNA or RNA helicase